MNYQRIYDNLIDYRKKNAVKGYSERHHIIPKCLGGSDESENLVRLTAREHYVAHHLLYKIHKTSKLAFAWFSMVCRTSGNQERSFTSRQYQRASVNRSNHLRKDMVGEGNPFYGRTHTEESKRKMSESSKGWAPSKEKIEKWVNDVAKKPKSINHRKKIGRKGLIMLKNSQTGEVVRVPKDHNYDISIWKNPYTLSRSASEVMICPFCDTSGKGSVMKRWHFDNCKHRTETAN